MMHLKACATFLVASVPIAAVSQTATSIGEMAELPAHQTLMTMIPDGPLAEFTTDGCSGGMSDIWSASAAKFPEWAKSQGEKPPWEACCVSHDRAYHNAAGATDAKKSFDARRSADETLRSCVLTQGTRDRAALAQRFDVSGTTIDTAYAGIAQAMYLAVRLGGGPCSGLPWRWGYGFPNCSILHRAWPSLGSKED
ncbi:MAG: hypothetical protein R8G34_02335 [Paracoccaceae bacterium]|nr:hypothetical protein [Paracoccaceae bacterium]